MSAAPSDDLLAGPARAAALARSRDTGLAIASMPARLRGGGTGILVSVPVYARDAPRDTRAHRRSALRGYAGAILSTRRLAATLPATRDIELTEDGRGVFGAARAGAVATSAAYAGRTWTIRATAEAVPLSGPVNGVLVGGLCLMIAAAALLLAHRRRESYALALVARRLAERDEAEDRFRILAERSSDLITRHRPDGRLLYVSPAVASLLGRRPEDLVGRVPMMLVHPGDAGCIRAAFAQLAASPDVARAVALRVRRADGSHAWLESVMHAVRDQRTGRTQEIQAVSRDISERKRLESRLRELADHDELTGLHNRRGLERELGPLCEAGAGGAVLAIGLDDFKEINDRHGHAAGDAVLVEVAWAMRRGLRAADVVARLGGDEFAIVLPGADAVHAREIADRLVEALRGLPGRPVTASVGLVTYRAAEALEAIAGLVARADDALYAAKRAGGDRVAAEAVAA